MPRILPADAQQQQMRGADPFPVLGIEYVELYVGNARVMAQHFRRLGFDVTWYRGLETGSTETASWIVSSGEINLMFTSALTPTHPVATHVKLHGDGVTDVALAVPDAATAFEIACARGAVAVKEPSSFAGSNGAVTRAAINMLGTTRHSFVSHTGDASYEALGFERLPAAGASRLSTIDHVSLAIQQGSLPVVVGFYRDVFGFAEMNLAALAKISTDYSALMSKVIEGGGGKVKFPIVESIRGPRRSQIQEFLDFNYAEGVQHLAFSTDDIVGMAAQFEAAGVKPLRIPDDYYIEVRDRVPEIADRLDDLQRYGILADKDEDGYLLQLFTEPLHDRPTLFFELIERHGSGGFGARNVRSLFEAIERSQVARGTL